MELLKNPELQFALKVVREALPVARLVQKELTFSSMTKNDRSPVTVADFSIQAIFGKRLSEAFPDDALIGEESSAALRSETDQSTLKSVVAYVSSIVHGANPDLICQWIDFGQKKSPKRFWTLDPIDGTKGFLRGAQYVTALALIENGEVKLSVIGCPHVSPSSEPDMKGEGSIVFALCGLGAWISPMNEDNFKPLSVSSRKESSEAILLGSVDPEHTDPDRLKKMMGLLQCKEKPRLMDSQAKYVFAAGGFGDFFLYFLSQSRPNYRMKIWDVAPGALVIEEAGGKITDLEGKKIDFSCGAALEKNLGLVVTNGYLHAQVFQAIANSKVNGS